MGQLETKADGMSGIESTYTDRDGDQIHVNPWYGDNGEVGVIDGIGLTITGLSRVSTSQTVIIDKADLDKWLGVVRSSSLARCKTCEGTGHV